MEKTLTLILSVIEKLHSRLPNISEYLAEEVNEVINELKIILYILLNNEFGEGNTLNYLICDAVELAQDIFAQDFYVDSYLILKGIEHARMRMLKLAVDGEEMGTRPGNVGGGDEEEGGVVGLEEEVEEVLRRGILGGERGLWISIIRGMAGVGKTTLARQVYNHADTLAGFDHRAWVSVSTEVTNKEVLMKLIEQVVVFRDDNQRDLLLEEMKRADNESLQQMLRQHLQGKRYFIVLDGVYELMHLKSITKGLPREAEGSDMEKLFRQLEFISSARQRTPEEGSRLLVTSTSHILRAPIPYDHAMKALNPEMSWKLFLKTISITEHEFPEKLKNKAREMLVACGGLPLAIKEVGKEIKRELESLEAGEIESALERHLESFHLDKTMKLLESSYQELNPVMKSCFLHLAFFKANSTMRANKLMQIWLAGGMVPKFKSKTSLLDLTSRSVMEVKEKDAYNEIKSCRINPMQHKLSITKAEEEIGFEIRGGNIVNRCLPSTRHRVVNGSREMSNYSSSDEDKHLVSLVFHGGGHFNASPSYWESFEQLRILDLEDFGIGILPKNIGSMVELRYLGLRNNYIQELPHSLRCLKKLEVLDIAQNFMVVVPDIIWDLDSLIDLHMSDVIFRRPWNKLGLKNLRTLTYISVDNLAYELTGLQVMTIHRLGIDGMDGNTDASTLFASLAKLESLYRLVLRGFRSRIMPSLDGLRCLESVHTLKLDGRLAKLPSADCFPPRVRYLKLVNTRLEEDPMPVLEKLSDMMHLKLRNAYAGRQMVISSGSFPMLGVLCMEDLRNLRHVQVGEDALRALTILKINRCPHLETRPEEMKHNIRNVHINP